MQPTQETYTAVSGEPVRYTGRDRRQVQDWLRFPVTGVSADDAEAYAGWLDRTSHVPGARLCTEYEWERGARGADDREFPHGSNLAADDVNYDSTYGPSKAGMGPDEVASHPASDSPFGLADMSGNAFEWVTTSPIAGQYGVRGGSYFHDRKTSRIVNRNDSTPALRDATLGLRICASFGADGLE
jgi:formylglycine-generating enzyme required for sulfatase activity